MFHKICSGGYTLTCHNSFIDGTTGLHKMILLFFKPYSVAQDLFQLLVEV